MAKTSFSTSDALTKKAWEEKLFRATTKETYFSKFSGEGADKIIQVKRNLQKSKGDQITFGLIRRLLQNAITSGQTMEGNEESLQRDSFNVSLEQYRIAVRDEGELDRQRAMFDIDEESEAALKRRGAEIIDQQIFDSLFGSFTKVFYPNSSAAFTSNASLATAVAALDATNSKLTLNFITQIKTWALSGGNRAYEPLRPVMVGGKPYLVLLVHHDVLADLKVSSAWQQANREAMDRGKENPIFSGAEAIWDGVVVHSHENATIGTDGGGGAVAYGLGVLMGQQAGVQAWGKAPTVIKETFDYEDEHGFCMKWVSKVGKTNFNSLDFGSLGVAFARTNISGI